MTRRDTVLAIATALVMIAALWMAWCGLPYIGVHL